MADNVALGREASQAGAKVLSQLFAPRSDIQVRDLATTEALELCGIADLAHLRAGALPTGQRRLVEHDMALVMDVCEYIYVLDFGRLIFEGAPAAVASSADVQAAYLGSETPHIAELEAEHDRHEHEEVSS